MLANLDHPGTGISIHELSRVSIQEHVSTAETAYHHGLMDTFVNIVQTNIFDVFIKKDELILAYTMAGYETVLSELMD